MNIVFVDGVINGLNKAKLIKTHQHYRYDIIIFKENVKLADLTGNLESDKLLKELHKLD